MENKCPYCGNHVDRIEHFYGGHGEHSECKITSVLKEKLAAVVNSKVLRNASFIDLILSNYSNTTEDNVVMILYNTSLWNLRFWIRFHWGTPSLNAKLYALLAFFKINTEYYAKRFYHKWFKANVGNVEIIDKKNLQNLNPFTEIKLEIADRRKIKEDMKILENTIFKEDSMIAFTDGSSISEFAGAGIVIIRKESEEIKEETLSLELGRGSNNFAETKALEAALEKLVPLQKENQKVKIYSDSLWLLMGVTKNWKISKHKNLIKNAKKI